MAPSTPFADCFPDPASLRRMRMLFPAPVGGVRLWRCWRLEPEAEPAADLVLMAIL